MLKIVFVFAILVVSAIVWTIWRREARRRSIVLAETEFGRLRPQLQEDFRAAANVTGKPRGLRWKSVDFRDKLVLGCDRANGEIIGLAAATIAFEAIEGGNMEEVEAVGNLRAGSAILTWNGREWLTTGKAVFNLEPREVLERYRESLAPIVA